MAVLAVLGTLCALPAGAGAEVREVGCAELKGALEAVGTEPQTIVLNGMCTEADLGELAVGPGHSGTNLTLRGAPGTVSGIDGTGKGAELFNAAGASTIALEDLTFENGPDWSAVHLHAGRVTIARDRFLDNAGSSGGWGAGLYVMTSGAGCPSPGGEPAIRVVSSTFRGNTLSRSGEVETAMGGGAYLADLCSGAGVAIEGSTFEANTVRNEDNATGGSANGGGLFVGAPGPAPPSLTQAGNVFAGNRVEGGPAPELERASFGGGGEWVEGMSLTSVRDRFSSNTVIGNTGEPPSGGAGLGLAGSGEVQTFPCGHEAPATASLEDDVLAGNVISGGTASGAAGAAIKLGCREGEGDRLTLIDSTVTANTSPAGGVAGIWGQPGASLTIANSIVEGDTGGTELGGFTAAPNVSSSDLCLPGSEGAAAGAGNICADPRLAGPPADVHETSLSPTRERGSNALVPAGLTTDYYGAPRIAGGTLQATCLEGIVNLAGPVVDIGAAEQPEALVRPLKVVCPLFRRSAFAFPSVSVRPGGVLLLTFHDLTRGTLVARAGIHLVKTATVTVHGKRRRVRKRVAVAYGEAKRLGTLGSPLRLRVVPKPRAAKALRHARRLQVSLSVTYAASRLFPATQSRALRVRWIAPPRRR